MGTLNAMKNIKRILLLLLIPCFIFLSGGNVALAEGVPGTNEYVSEITYDTTYITHIEPLESNAIATEHKLALDSLLEELPETLFITLGGKVSYRPDGSFDVSDGDKMEIPVKWKCDGNYDEILSSFLFIPDLSAYNLIPDLELPQISVLIEKYEPDLPTGYFIPDDYVAVESMQLMDTGLLYASSSQYNAYELGVLPPIRSQGEEGACWAFASIGAVEADLIADDGESQYIDLSELQVAYFLAHKDYDPKGCSNGDTLNCRISDYLDNGGNMAMAVRSFSRRIGPVDEEEAPYSLGSYYTLADELACQKNVAFVKNAYKINISDRELIKQEIKNHGAVTASYCATPGDYSSGGEVYSVRYSATYNSFYGNFSYANHAVMLVGWDDNFPKENFHADLKPAGDGAWLVRNSWGLNDYGEHGYFWLSYYDAGLQQGKEVRVFDADREQYDNVYAYDGMAFADSFYTLSSGSGVLQEFDIDGGEDIVAISFDTMTSNLKVDAVVSDGTTTVSESMETFYAGYYTLELSTPLSVEEDTRVTVELHFSSLNGDDITVVCERTSSYTANYITAVGVHEAPKTALMENNLEYCIDMDARVRVYTDNKLKPVSTVPKIDSCCLSLQGRIGVNTLLDLGSLKEELLDGGTVEVSDATGATIYQISELPIVDIGNDEMRYSITYNVPAKDITQDFEIRLFDKMHNAIAFSNANTEDFYGYQQSVWKFLENCVACEDMSTEELAVAIAQMGQYAQIYFGQADTDTELLRLIGEERYNQFVTDAAAIESSTLEAYQKEYDENLQGVSYSGSTMILDDKTCIRHYFRIQENTEITEYCFTVDGKELTPGKKGELYYVEIQNIPPALFDTYFTLEVTDREESGNAFTLRYCAYSYFYDCFVKSGDSKLTDLARCMYLCGQKAKEYFQ